MNIIRSSELNCSQHAIKRAQQRGIPQIVDGWLADYGTEQYDGSGGVIVYFSRESIRRLEREFGRKPVQLLSRYPDCYKAVSANDGTVITTGHRSRRVRRR